MNLEELKKEIPEIFEQVKNDVEEVISRHQSGYRLGLVSMGTEYKKYVGIILRDRRAGGIDITILINLDPINSYLLEKQPNKIVRAYTYHILLYGYLSSLVSYDGHICINIYDEPQCKKVTLEISKKIFKDPRHPAVILATKGTGASYFAYLPSSSVLKKGWHIEWIENFDKSSLNYFM
ncbi:MAG: hypothetical protein HWN65_12180 [Candidatus Helarchaeota archaeon]|nr:hypothetical protein [Candidatus Helarchaeota archaeon]